MNTERKPHSGNAGYVCELRCKLGGHIVVYDRDAGFEIDSDYRWIVLHEPSGKHIAVRSQDQAREIMKGLAKARTLDQALEHADVIPGPDDAIDHVDGKPAGYATSQQALERFLADPENEPTREGIEALHEAFGLNDPRHWPR